jgi:hypothetical protein
MSDADIVGKDGGVMVRLREVRRAAEREEQFRAMQQALRVTFQCVAEEPVPERLRLLIQRLQDRLDD